MFLCTVYLYLFEIVLLEFLISLWAVLLYMLTVFVWLATSSTSSRERPWSAILSPDDQAMVTVAAVVPRRNHSILPFNKSNLSKSISISNIAGWDTTPINHQPTHYRPLHTRVVQRMYIFMLTHSSTILCTHKCCVKCIVHELYNQSVYTTYVITVTVPPSLTLFLSSTLSVCLSVRAGHWWMRCHWRAWSTCPSPQTHCTRPPRSMSPLSLSLMKVR